MFDILNTYVRTYVRTIIDLETYVHTINFIVDFSVSFTEILLCFGSHSLRIDDWQIAMTVWVFPTSTMKKTGLKSRSRRKTTTGTTHTPTQSTSNPLSSSSDASTGNVVNSTNSSNERRKPTSEEAALTAKNYRLAKELVSSIYIPHFLLKRLTLFLDVYYKNTVIHLIHGFKKFKRIARIFWWFEIWFSIVIRFLSDEKNNDP